MRVHRRHLQAEAVDLVGRVRARVELLHLQLLEPAEQHRPHVDAQQPLRLAEERLELAARRDGELDARKLLELERPVWSNAAKMASLGGLWLQGYGILV